MKLLYYDYCALFILAILLFSSIFRGLTKGRLNKCFMELLTLSLISVVADILSVLFDVHAGVPLPLKYIVHTIYLVSHNLMPALYVIYIMILTDTDYRMNGHRRVLFIIPFSAVVFISLLNIFTGWLFYFDDELNYTRGVLFPVLYITAVLYILHILVLMARFGRALSLLSRIAIGGIVPMMAVATIVQFLRPDLLFEMFANSLSMLLVSTLINRPEDILDTESGLSNRKACTDTLKRCIKNRKPIELILLNITNYKFVEGIVGYEGMLKIMRKVSDRILGINRIHRVFSELFYLGDGRFCFEMNSRKFDKTTYMAHYLNEILSIPISYASMELSLNAVICVTRCPEDIHDAESVMAFQEDLTSGFYNGNVLFASEIYSGYHYSLMRQIDSIIENALANKLFEVYYQPIYSIHDDRFNSAEALIRLKDETYGFISPEFFIPAAEKSGAIHRIGAFVLEEVCKFIGSPEFEGLGVDYIEVNLSAAQCMRNDLHKEVLKIMRRYGIDHSRINLEITETAASASQDTLEENMRKLESKGLTFSLDDYGTGYSNMDRVSSMNFRIIKLDKSFVNVQRNEKRDIVLDNTVNMIKELGMKIVVEGVESAEILQRFADLQCDYIQGFFFSKPIPKPDFIEYIKRQNGIRQG